MKWITALDLERWAGTLDARSALSELVSALVRGTATEIGSFRFPSGDSAQLPGYDGRLQAVGSPPFVPDGWSVWEFGAGEDHQRKATVEYNKRSADPGTAVPAETTFVFVTPRTYRETQEKERWVEERRRERRWLDVRLLDGVDLEAWLQQTPAVAAAFATGVLKLMPPAGVMSADDFWTDYAGRTDPLLVERVLLAGREEEVKQLLDSLAEPAARHIVIRADSRDEALAFVIAAMRTSETEVRKFLDARSIIVDDAEVARRLSNRGGLIVGVRAMATPLSSALVQRGNFVIIPLGNDAPNQRGVTFRLPRPPRSIFGSALESMGVGAAHAERLARESGRSVTVLQRRIPGPPYPNPGWVTSQATQQALVPALLAGAWDSASEADRTIIERLARQPYEEFERQLLPLLNVEDPPLDRVGSVWIVMAPVDVFELLAHYVAQQDLDLLRAAVVEVFQELDPVLELPPHERPYAGLRGVRLRHSRWLRDGLAGTLLLIAVRGVHAELFCEGGTKGFVEGLIAGLPGLAADHRLIASLGSQLPLLMEAAPDPFLRALERLLEGDGSAIAGIFSEGGALGPTSPHTQLLWGLELLAWDPSRLSQVALTLATLARLDPGGRLSNRPINSLREIFLPWKPGTNAPLASRIRALDMVLASEPLVGWDLLVELLPRHSETSLGTHRPNWHDFGASECVATTWPTVLQAYREIAHRVISRIGDDPNRWKILINTIQTLPPESRAEAFELLEQFAAAEVPAEARVEVWSAVRQEVSRQRRVIAATSTLPLTEVERLHAILQDLEPADTVQQSAWLFDEYFPELPNPELKRSYEEIERLRSDAVRTLLATERTDVVLQLAERVRISGLVGAAAALAADDSALAELLDLSLMRGEALVPFAMTLSGQAARLRGAEWRNYIVRRASEAQWTPDQVATSMLGWPDERCTWDTIASLGTEVERRYWLRKAAWPLQGSPEDLTLAAEKYLTAGRATAAIESLSAVVSQLPVNLVFALLDSALAEVNESVSPQARRFLHELDDVFEALSEREDVPRLEVARREYAWLPLLLHRSDERTLTLHRLLADEPSLFVQVLSDVFKAHSSGDQKPTEDMRARAALGFELLQSWRRVPGVGEDASVDALALKAWIAEARTQAAERDRAVVGDLQIGRILAYTPTDEDGAWPHHVVRNIIEELGSEDIERGIATELFNKRGVYRKAVFEGGAQEQVLAQEARGWARVAAVEWPRTARLLEDVSKQWQDKATREDESAEEDKLRLS